jgi:hypothetical protein
VSLSGGDKVARVLNELAAKLGRKPTLRVGFLQGATYPDGTAVSMVAAIHEYGAPAAGIPARPFMRPTIARNRNQWGKDLSHLLEVNDYDVVRSLNLLGEHVKGQIQEAITKVTSPPLKPATVAAKGSAKPLIDTGHMLNSVDYNVEE